MSFERLSVPTQCEYVRLRLSLPRLTLVYLVAFLGAIGFALLAFLWPWCGWLAGAAATACGIYLVRAARVLDRLAEIDRTCIEIPRPKVMRR